VSEKLAKIDFHGDDIIAFEDEKTGKTYASIRRMCESLGIQFSTQRRKLASDPCYEQGLRYVHMNTPSGKQELLFLDKKYIPKWLGSISVPKVKPEIRDKLLQYQLEIVEALDNYFTQGFALNERALEQAPNAVISKIAEQISAKLGIAPTLPKEQLIKDRMRAMNAIFETLGRPDEMMVTTLRNQALAELAGLKPALTLHEQDRWYAADFWRFKKREGFLSVGYKHENTLINMLGRHASRVSRRRRLPIYNQNQIIDSGRAIVVHQYTKEALEYALERLLAEGKVVRQQECV
jgi:hypothetical protein